MTELYDDCNHLNKRESWLNKQHRAMEIRWKEGMAETIMRGPTLTTPSPFIQIGDAWYTLEAFDAEKRMMKAAAEYNKMRLLDSTGAQFAQMQDELCTCNKPRPDASEFKSNID